MKCTQSFLAIRPVKSVCSFRYAELLQVVDRVYIISYLQASTTVPLPCLQCMHFTLVLAKGFGVGRVMWELTAAYCYVLWQLTAAYCSMCN